MTQHTANGGSQSSEPGVEPEIADYGDCRNQGHMVATWKAENLCFRCVLAQVCHVALATGQLGDSLIVVSRCRSFTPPNDTSV